MGDTDLRGTGRPGPSPLGSPTGEREPAAVGRDPPRRERDMPPHCDSLDGPDVKAAGEDEIRAAFERTTAARRNPAAREVAELYFFETVVRVHRRGEGAP